ncbi:hypothetical protein [Paenibacillus sp. FSL H8-0537]|uniref:hypothetical protein n=1 Tax=Paenibacillus sp. FSL H8-0537 TaxID=2921399 RepID=UPI00310106AB
MVLANFGDLQIILLCVKLKAFPKMNLAILYDFFFAAVGAAVYEFKIFPDKLLIIIIKNFQKPVFKFKAQDGAGYSAMAFLAAAFQQQIIEITVFMGR